ITQDGSVNKVSYTGNCTTATDEAGNRRKGCTDALGRLIEVREPNPTVPAVAAFGDVTISGALKSQSINGAQATATLSISGGPSCDNQGDVGFVTLNVGNAS